MSISSRTNISVNITGVPIRINGIPFAGVKSSPEKETRDTIIKLITNPETLFE
jgi:hypothetical protein